MFNIFKRQKKAGNKVSKKYWGIQSVHSGNMLDAAEGKPNADAILWKDNGDDNQQYTFTPNEKGQYRIKNRKTQQYLTVSGNQQGAKIVLRGNENGPNQWFSLKQVHDKTYEIITCYGMVVDVKDCSKQKGAHVIQWKHNGGKNQQWRIQDPKDVTSSSSDWQGGW